MSEKRIRFDDLELADLIVDAVYEGGLAKNVGADPLAKLMPGGNSGGFRPARNQYGDGWNLVVLYSTGEDPDWPDVLDVENGQFTYYGDNKKPGHELHDTPKKGNEILRVSFAALHGQPPDRELIPPFFVFTKSGRGRDVRFRGLAVPGSEEIPPTQDLVALWRTTEGQRFQNYRAVFTILDIARVSREWIDDLKKGNRLSPACPTVYADWLKHGKYRPLRAPRTLEYRPKAEQLPTTQQGWKMLRSIHGYFRDDPYGFEECAATIWKLIAGDAVTDWEITLRSRDGGRDAVGHFALGPATDRVLLDFALEAKCYDPGGSGVGVPETARLISRLKHRQFGVFVTTAFVGKQAYQEIRDDRHPIVIISGRDILEVLAKLGVSTDTEIRSWLIRNFPHP